MVMNAIRPHPSDKRCGERIAASFLKRRPFLTHRDSTKLSEPCERIAAILQIVQTKIANGFQNEGSTTARVMRKGCAMSVSPYLRSGCGVAGACRVAGSATSRTQISDATARSARASSGTRERSGHFIPRNVPAGTREHRHRPAKASFNRPEPVIARKHMRSCGNLGSLADLSSLGADAGRHIEGSRPVRGNVFDG
jgi:hypothetical protein